MSTFVQFKVAVIVCNEETDVFLAFAQRRGSPGRGSAARALGAAPGAPGAACRALEPWPTAGRAAGVL